MGLLWFCFYSYICILYQYIVFVIYVCVCVVVVVVVQLCHVPFFTAELFVNFDCGLYCTNVFESLTKLLSKVSGATS